MCSQRAITFPLSFHFAGFNKPNSPDFFLYDRLSIALNIPVAPLNTCSSLNSSFVTSICTQFSRREVPSALYRNISVSLSLPSTLSNERKKNSNQKIWVSLQNCSCAVNILVSQSMWYAWKMKPKGIYKKYTGLKRQLTAWALTSRHTAGLTWAFFLLKWLIKSVGSCLHRKKNPNSQQKSSPKLQWFLCQYSQRVDATISE